MNKKVFGCILMRPYYFFYILWKKLPAFLLNLELKIDRGENLQVLWMSLYPVIRI